LGVSIRSPKGKDHEGLEQAEAGLGTRAKDVTKSAREKYGLNG